MITLPIVTRRGRRIAILAFTRQYAEFRRQGLGGLREFHSYRMNTWNVAPTVERPRRSFGQLPANGILVNRQTLADIQAWGRNEQPVRGNPSDDAMAAACAAIAMLR